VSRPANLVPPGTNEPAGVIVPTGGEPEKEKDPGSAFGPESVPLATGSVSVVYWVPGPFPRPTPCPPDLRRRPPQPFLCHVGLGSGWMRTPPAMTLLRT
jgi:hypothetical protein